MKNVVTVSIPYACCETTASYLLDFGFSEIAAAIMLEKSGLTKAYSRQAPDTFVEITIDYNTYEVTMCGKSKSVV